VHRDVKPANIMFDHDGRVMLTDFGISKALQAATGFTGTGMIIGTPHYMAPEQAKGATVDGRADQYSLGVVAYRMITHELPYTGDSVHTILYKHIFEEIPSARAKRADAPEFLTRAISRALSKEPAQRFDTMEDFATAVWPEQPVTAPKAGASKSQRRPPPRPQRTASADAPTEVTSAPTTPIPRAGMKIPAAKKKRSGVGILVGAIVVVAAGVGGYLTLGRKSAAPSPPPPPPAAVVPGETQRVVAQPPPPPPARRPPPAPPPAAAAEQGFITVNSIPPGEVFIDGRDVGPTPVVEFTVSPGRHSIRVERAGYKTRSETVDVPPNGPVRKNWVLDPEG